MRGVALILLGEGLEGAFRHSGECGPVEDSSVGVSYSEIRNAERFERRSSYRGLPSIAEGDCINAEFSGVHVGDFSFIALGEHA